MSIVNLFMKLHQSRPGKLALLFVCAVIAQGCATAKPQTFASPELAVDDMVSALQPLDKNRLDAIFGAKGNELVSSGDAVADQQSAARFLEGYNQKHELLANPDGSRTLQIGDNDWPFPVPIVEHDGQWFFDTEAGLEEILNRRVGQNELYTIQVCLTVVDAQREFALLDPNNDGLNEYARRFISDPDTGVRDGLYWQTGPDEPPSPLGALVADATAEGYQRGENNQPIPFHGYFYRMLTAQGPAAPGGAFDYMVDNHMIGGFAVVAWPAQHGNSGVMTFITNQDGVVYQQNLGGDTSSAATEMKHFNPDSSWSVVP